MAAKAALSPLRKLIIVAISAGLCFNASHAMAWTITDLGALKPAAINDSGLVTGSVGGEAFIWTSATGMQLLGTLPGKGRSYGLSVNGIGQVLGTTDDLAGLSGFPWGAGFLWSYTADMQALPLNWGVGGLSDLGQVAGAVDLSNGHL